MIAKMLVMAALTIVTTGPLAAQVAGETVTETTTEIEKKDVKVFCSKKDDADAGAQCEKWLAAQKATLGARVLTAHCGNGDIGTTDCLFKAQGEVTFVLKESKKETKR